MNNSAARVGEIFAEAGTSFKKLAEMTAALHPVVESQPGTKWTDDEIEMLRSCVHRFAIDLNKISHHIKNRTMAQISGTLKRKAFEDAGLTCVPMRKIQGASLSPVESPVPKQQVTLNMLNASESEVDVDGLENDVKLDFETNDEEDT